MNANICSINETMSLYTYAAQTNSHLLHVLSDLVKTFLDTEHDIQKQLVVMGIESNPNREDVQQGFTSLVEDNIERLSETNELCEDGPDLMPSSHLLYLTPPSTSISGQSEVELEDDVVLGASRRLRAAVDRILKLLSEIVAAHQEHDFNSLLKKNEELVSELNEECTRRDKLTAQLLQIEDRVKTLEREKTSLSAKVNDYNEAKHQMQTMRAKVEEYEAERDRWLSDQKRFEKERSCFAQGLPQLQQITKASSAQIALCTTELISDNDALNTDVRQLQHERIKLLQRIHTLTLESEHLRSERDEIIEEKRRECEDFMAQIEANEKNLTSYRRFIDEQTHERESEREEFNKELTNLMEKLKEKDKNEIKLKSHLDEMESQVFLLNEEKCNKEKHFNAINSRLKCVNQELSELKAVISQMERESDKCTQLERQLRTRVRDLNEALDMQIKINEETHQEELTNFILERITTKTHELQTTLGSNECESESEDASIECSYSDARHLSEKLNALNECINQLLIQNETLKVQLDQAKSENKKDCDQIVRDKQSLERNLMEMMRSNEVLQEELNSKHLQLSALKSRLEANVDSTQLKCMINELQTKLLAEEQKCNQLDFQIVNLKQQLDDKNNKIRQLIDEVNALKRQIKAMDSEKSALIRENEELKLKLSSKDTKIHSEGENKHILEQQIISFKQQLDERNSKIIQLNDEMSSFKHCFQTVDSEKLALLRENEELKLKVNSKDAILLSEEQNRSVLNYQFLALKQQLGEKDDKILHLNDECNAFKRQLKSIDNEKSDLVKEIDELKLKLSSKNAIIFAEEQNRNALDYQISNLKQQIDDKNNKTLQLIDEVYSLKRHIKIIDSEKLDLVRENDDLRTKLSTKDGILISEDLKRNSIDIQSAITKQDDEKIQGMSNQVLWKRVISHKNALIYQKKYLLHVLGGFQLTERATLALLANMNVTVDELPSYRSGRNRFRSAVYAIIAIWRLKYLVNKWKYVNSHYKSKSSLRTVSSNSLAANSESQTNSTLQEFVNRLQVLHDTLGLRSAHI